MCKVLMFNFLFPPSSKISFSYFATWNFPMPTANARALLLSCPGLIVSVRTEAEPDSSRQDRTSSLEPSWMRPKNCSRVHSVFLSSSPVESHLTKAVRRQRQRPPTLRQRRQWRAPWRQVDEVPPLEKPPCQ